MIEERRKTNTLSLKPESELAVLDILASQNEQLERLEKLCNRFVDAIPGDDPEGHRRYHELVIQREEDRAAIRKAVIEKSLAALVWSALVALGSSIWLYIQHHLGGTH